MRLLGSLLSRRSLSAAAVTSAPLLLRRSYSPPYKPPSKDSPQALLPSSEKVNHSNLGPGFRIAVVDPDSWSLSFAAAESLGFPSCAASSIHSDELDVSAASEGLPLHDSDDELDGMRVRKQLYYKVERESLEFDECNVSLRRRRTVKNGRHEKKLANSKVSDKSANSKDLDSTVMPGPSHSVGMGGDLDDGGEVISVANKRVRTPSFDNATDQYHRPFCLDIHVTKGSVRACVVHRVTSRVVAVAHSISKDLKCDLSSRKDAKACETVGAVLAKRAIEDDIYNLMYTPRKGEQIEGKIEIVLRAIRENGIDVEVKLKQQNRRRLAKASPVYLQGLT